MEGPGGHRPPVQVEVNINVATVAASVEQLGKKLNALTNTLQRYDGTGNVTDWLSDFDSYCHDVGRLSEDDRRNCLVGHLTNEAKAWFRLQPHGATVDELIEALKLRFNPTELQLHQRKMQLFAMSQRVNQSFAEFVRELQEEARGLHMSEVDLVRIALSGAKQNIKAHLTMAQPATISALCRLPIVTDESLLIAGESNVDAINTIATRIGKMQAELNNTEIQRIGTEKCGKCGLMYCQGRQNCQAFNRKCYKCSIKNHFARCCKTLFI